MAGIQNFRSALGGFNRQDVVQYIEYINNQHNSQIEQLHTQLRNAEAALARAEGNSNTELQAQLEASQAKCAELEAQLAATVPAEKTDDELEAYRRAERAERLAQERASQIYAKANAVLADATLMAEEAAKGMDTVAQQISAQLEASRQQLQEAVAAMYAIRPEEE